MHDQEIVHGGLRGVRFEPHCCYPSHSSHSPKANILINNDGHACLSGLGLLTIPSDQRIATPLDAMGDAVQWMSPELIAPRKFSLENRATKESDCYALGMVIYEVLSEQVPFAPREGTAIISDVVGGERPGRPQGREGARFTDGLWQMLEGCWKHQPGDRPILGVVLACLQDDGKLTVRPRQGGPKGGLVSKAFRNTLKAFNVIAGKPHGP